jgi:hypothetical protein
VGEFLVVFTGFFQLVSEPILSVRMKRKEV